jgi:hypothetical protein
MQNKREKWLIEHGKIHCTQYAKTESKKEGRKKKRERKKERETLGGRNERNECGRTEKKKELPYCAHSHVQRCPFALSLSLSLSLSSCYMFLSHVQHITAASVSTSILILMRHLPGCVPRCSARLTLPKATT